MANQEALIIKDSGGTEADVTAANALKVDNSAVTQPVSAASLPLPAGAAIAANQQTDALTDAELRATPVPVSGTVAVTGSATAANQVTEIASLASIDTKTPALGQALAAASTPVVLTAIQQAALTPPAAITGFLTEADFDTKTGSLTEVAPATDTASSGLNGRLQRIAQRITSLITALGSPFQAGGSIGNTSFGATQATAANLNMTEANSAAIKTAVELLDNAIAGSEMQVDVVAPLPAGTNNIGDVDVLSQAPTTDIFGTGSLTALNSAVTVLSNGISGCIIRIGAGLSGTVVLEGSTDGFTTSQNISVLILATGLSTSLGMTSSGYYRGINTAAWTQLRIRVSAYTSGSCTSTINLSQEHNIFTVVQQKAANLNVAVGSFNPENSAVLFRGQSASFRTLGRAGTAGQKILALHNATGSTLTLKVNKIVVDMWATVVKAVTVAPPIVRIWKFTAVPTNGTQITKNKVGGTSTSNAFATLWNDSSSDGTGSATTLTVTLPAGTILDSKVAPRIITAVGEVNMRSMEFEYPQGIQLAPLEGVCVFLDYTAATQNPTTDMWVASINWEEALT